MCRRIQPYNKYITLKKETRARSSSLPFAPSWGQGVRVIDNTWNVGVGYSKRGDETEDKMDRQDTKTDGFNSLCTNGT